MCLSRNNVLSVLFVIQSNRITVLRFNLFNATFQCCEHHKLNSFTSIILLRRQKFQRQIKLSAWIDTTKGRREHLFFVI